MNEETAVGGMLGWELSDALSAAGSKALAMAALEQALRDLQAILKGDAVDGEKLSQCERDSMFDELYNWIFDPAPAPYSFEVVCAAIGYNAEWRRERLQQVLQGKRPMYLSRRGLSDADVVEIRAKLKAGNSKASVAREYGLAAGYVSRMGNGKRRAA